MRHGIFAAKYKGASLNMPDQHSQLAGIAQAWLPTLTAVVGAIWGLWLYVDQHQKDREQASEQAVRDSRARIIEAQKPFLDKQLGLYFETAQVVGRLVQTDWTSDAWKADDNRFWELYWSELTMVEHKSVAQSMHDFGELLKKLEQSMDKPHQDALHTASLKLAEALRNGIQSSWGDPQTDIVAK
jgi:hypothetical protein